MNHNALKNRIVEFEGSKVRILRTDEISNTAYCIDIESKKAWPVGLPLSAVSQLPALVGQGFAPPVKMSKLEKDCMDRAWACLGPLIEKHDPLELFDPKRRKAAIDRTCKSLGCAPSTLYKYLRKYWQRGQVPAALIPDFRRPVRDVDSPNYDRKVTGPKYDVDGAAVDPHQLTLDDFKCMKDICENVLLKERRARVTHAYNALVNQYYMLTDGNGNPYRAPNGSLPSLRQFRYFYTKHYDIETRLRAKHGDKNFELKHRAVLGIMGQDTPFAAHSYEIDATKLPVMAVSMHDQTFIVGRPTLYLIICRATRLLVGYYLGMEEASWMAAMAAIYCIVEDKRELCDRYDVPYDPTDWPAHGILPSEFITDRGSEWTSRLSDDFVARTGCTVKNLPAGRADWKPFVENCHNLLQEALRTFEPSFNPDSNANARQSVDYDKNACCNLHVMNGFVLRAMIAYNKRVLLGFKASLEQITGELELSPVNIWNDSVEKQSGLLTATSAEDVRFQLLPRERATVTEKGIVFKHMTYLVDPRLMDRLFVRARRKTFRIDVSYDPRLVDSIFIHDIEKDRGPVEATLGPRSEQYAGRSFAEVARIEEKRRKNNREAEAGRQESRIALLAACKPIADAALAQMKEVTQDKPRSARRKDVKEARSAEVTLERQTSAMTAPIKTPKPVKAKGSASSLSGSLSSVIVPKVRSGGLGLLKSALAGRQ